MMHRLITHPTRVIRFCWVAALWLVTFLVMMGVTLGAVEFLGVAHASVR